MAKRKQSVPQFNEIKYQDALETLAVQLVAMVIEDEGEIYDLEDYSADAVYALTERVKELFKKASK